jgi:type IV pilus assembly protein PilY1
VQPISVQPTVIPHSSGGWLVLFGTGKLIVDTDQDDTTTQTFYAVRDKTLAGATSTSATSPYEADIAAGTPRKSLVEQVISADATPGLFDVTGNKVDYSTNNGWFMDLSPVKSTQRVQFPAVMLNQFVLINTISPADKPSGPCDTSQGNSAYFLLPAYTGAQYSSPVWDTNGDGKVDETDSKAAGYQSGDEGGKTTVVQLQDGSCENLNSSGGGKVCKVPHGIKSRFVQQLMTPPF